MKNGAFAQSIWKQSATKMEDLDTVRILEDGRMFAYAQAGASDLSPGKLVITPAPNTTNARDIAVITASVVGDTSIVVTFGGAVTADFYADGLLYVNDDTGEGFMPYRVKSHAAGTASVTVYLKDPIAIANTTSSTVSLVQPRQKLVVLSTFAQTGVICGVPPIAVTALYYFWNQVKGRAVVWVSGTEVIGNVIGQIAVAGAVTPLGTADIIGSLGVAEMVQTTTEYGLVDLAIAGY